MARTLPDIKDLLGLADGEAAGYTAGGNDSVASLQQALDRLRTWGANNDAARNYIDKLQVGPAPLADSQ